MIENFYTPEQVIEYSQVDILGQLEVAQVGKIILKKIYLVKLANFRLMRRSEGGVFQG
jgi:hypothetical protein